jgi:hypothetical protein
MIYKENTFVKYAQKKIPTKHLEKRSKTDYDWKIVSKYFEQETYVLGILYV